MPTKKYTYNGLGKAKQLFFQITGFLAIVIFTIFGFAFFYAAMNGSKVPSGIGFMDDPRVPPFCLGTIFILGAWFFGLMFINLLPTIWTDESGITISFILVFHKNIPWKNVLAIEPISSPFDYYIVKARKITVLHRMIGWIYSKTFSPSFLIAKEIENRKELIWAIQAKTRRQE